MPFGFASNKFRLFLEELGKALRGKKTVPVSADSSGYLLVFILYFKTLSYLFILSAKDSKRFL